MKNEKLSFKHTPVLLNECIENLKIKQDGIYIDGTLGGAGHSIEILKKLSEKGKLIGIDKDIEAIETAKEKLRKFKNVIYINDNHDNIQKIIEKLDINQIDGILLDLGVSSYQIDEVSRGFSYIKDSPLDMRMDKNQELTAYEVINKYDEERLANIIYEYGEEKFSRKIANNICEYRKKEEIKTTTQLVEIIEKSVPSFNRQKQGHPAKKTFQAIRIEVNNEIKPLYNTVINSINCLSSGGRLCIITFHSLEDRAVKMAYIDSIGKCTCPKDLPYCICNKKSLRRNYNKKTNNTNRK